MNIWFTAYQPTSLRQKFGSTQFETSLREKNLEISTLPSLAFCGPSSSGPNSFQSARQTIHQDTRLRHVERDRGLGILTRCLGRAATIAWQDLFCRVACKSVGRATGSMSMHALPDRLAGNRHSADAVAFGSSGTPKALSQRRSKERDRYRPIQYSIYTDVREKGARRISKGGWKA